MCQLSHYAAAGFGCSGGFLQHFFTLTGNSLIGKVFVTDTTDTACHPQ